MFENKVNSPSQIALEIIKKGLTKKAIFPNTKWKGVIEECYTPPEKPKEFKFGFETKDVSIAVLFSGGMDSYIAYLRAKENYKNVQAFYCQFPTKYTEFEDKAIEELGIEVVKIDFPFKKNFEGGIWRHIIPGRNFYFICQVVEMLKEGGEIWLAANDGEIPEAGGDKSIRFLEEVNKVLAYLPYPVLVKYPLLKETKTDLVRWYLTRQYSVEKLRKTRTCQDDTEKDCGNCQACFRRAVAFFNNDIYERGDFIVDPFIGAIEDYRWKIEKIKEEYKTGNYTCYSPNSYYELKKFFEKYRKPR